MTDSIYQHFKHLHASRQPLLLPNAWDARSAVEFQRKGFAAVGTSSAAMASMLGYTDGEQLPFAELRYVVARVCASTTLPVTVDLEGGYSRDPKQIAAHVQELAELGVVGINLEDSVTEAGCRTLLPLTVFAETVAYIRNFCTQRQITVFLNVRTDTYLLNVADRSQQTLARLLAYEAAGADGFFVPGLIDLAEVRMLCQATPLPLNVMCLPGLPDFAALAGAGVRRISMGNFLFEALVTRQQQLSDQIVQSQNFASLFA